MTLPEKILNKALQSQKQIVNRAHEVDGALRSIGVAVKRAFVDTGRLICEAEDDGLWTHLTSPHTGELYNTFDEWLESASPYGRSSSYEARNCFRVLGGKMELQDMAEIKRDNLVEMKKLPEITPEWVAMAKDLSVTDFKESVGSETSDLHYEKPKRFVIQLWESEDDLATKALAHAIAELKGDGNHDASLKDAFMFIIQTFLER